MRRLKLRLYCLQLRDEMLRLKADADEARVHIREEAEARDELQRRHEILVAQWRSAVEQREREMEELQERMNPPRDLELLRVQVRIRDSYFS